MRLSPFEDRVVVRREEAPDKTPGGIVLPDAAKERVAIGIVVAVGPGRMLDMGEIALMTAREGDRVAFGQYSGSEIKLDGDDFLILRESDIFGVLKE